MSRSRKNPGKALLDLTKDGITAVYVSHSMEAVKKTCDRAIWLEHGEIRVKDEAGLVMEEYFKAQGQLGGGRDE